MEALLKVLLIDDTKLFRQLITAHLGQKFDMQEASTWTEAQSIIYSSTLIDLIILDLCLMDKEDTQIGLNRILEIRKKRMNIPIIIISNYAGEESIQAEIAILNEADDYIWKGSDNFSQKLEKSIIYNTKIEIIGESVVMKKIKADLDFIANRPKVKALICGERGTGKNMAYRYIKNKQHLRHKHAIEILHDFDEFERIHHHYKEAHGGIFFFDEICRGSKEFQEIIGEIIDQEKGNKVIILTTRLKTDEHIDIRIPEPLRTCYNYLVMLPPLRERKDDIPYWISHFLKTESIEVAKSLFSEEAWSLINNYHWEENIKELKKIIKIAEQKSDIDKNGKINDEWIKYFIREKAKTTSDINWQSEVRQLIIKAKIEHAFELSLSKHPQNPILILYSSEYNYYKEGVTKGLIDPYNNVIRNQIIYRLLGFINDI